MIPREPVLGAMRRPATIFGVHSQAVIANLVVTAYLFTGTGSLWTLAAALPIHAICWLITLIDPFAFRLLGLKAMHTIETISNRSLWGCSSRDPNGSNRRKRA